MRAWLVLLMVAIAAPVAAQQGKGAGAKGNPGGQNMSQEDRRKLREDVNSARGDYGRQDRHRQDRMAPEEREKLRRDVQDANRDLRKR